MMTWRRWLSLVDMDWSDAAICLSLLMWESVEWVRVESPFLSLSLSLFLSSLRHAVCFSLLSSPLQGHFLLCLLCFSVACLGSDSSFFLPLYFSWFFQNSKYSFGYSWLFFEMGFWVFFFCFSYGFLESLSPRDLGNCHFSCYCLWFFFCSLWMHYSEI